ncbi:MAG: ParB/RepB/Spo0J family partition protein [Eubacterium sp.]|nr:ParB/RepB/Spo0J family partition protein [Eubacterium sp.]
MGVIFKTKDKGSITELQTAVIFPNPNQPRKEFDQQELAGLAQSIKENGILQPLTVRKTEDGRYELIAGERRLRAARLAGLSVVPVIVADKTAQESAVLSILENIQRSDLNYFEEAEAISRLIEYYGFTQEEVAKKLGKAQSTVANKLRLLRLSPEIKNAVISYGLRERQVRALLKLPEEQRADAAEKIHKMNFNASQTDAYIEELLHPKPQKQQLRRRWLFKEKLLYINNINRTIETMRQSGVEFDSTKRIENGYIEYIIRIPQDSPVN